MQGMVFWIVVVYLLLSAIETVRTSKNYSHVWGSSKPQFIMLIVISILLGGLKIISNVIAEIGRFFEKLMTKIGQE